MWGCIAGAGLDSSTVPMDCSPTDSSPTESPLARRIIPRADRARARARLAAWIAFSPYGSLLSLSAFVDRLRWIARCHGRRGGRIPQDVVALSHRRFLSPRARRPSKLQRCPSEGDGHGFSRDVEPSAGPHGAARAESRRP